MKQKMSGTEDGVDLWASITYVNHSQSVQQRRLDELQKLRLLQKFLIWVGEGSVIEICRR